MIPLSVPNIQGNAWKYVRECLDTGWVSSAGSYVDVFEKKIAAYTGARYAISTVNGTAALHIALMLAGVQQGDFVILPNITFVASANAIRYLGAYPLLCDVREDTWQLDVELLSAWLDMHGEYDGEILRHKESGRRISALLPVHVLGNMVDMEALQALAGKYDLPVVEDAAEALGSRYKGHHAGTLGKLGCLSFNGNKIMTTGGGGMILTNDEALALRARHLTQQAKTDPRAYDHDEIGYNYRMVNLLAALGVAQLEHMASFLEAKARIAQTYSEAFSDLSFISPQKTTAETVPNHWLYTVYLPRNTDLLDHLEHHQIQSRPLWRPMSQLPMFTELPYIHRDDISRKLHQGCLSIPCSTNLTLEDQHEVIKQIRHFFD